MTEQVYRSRGLALPLLVTIVMGAIGLLFLFQFVG